MTGGAAAGTPGAGSLISRFTPRFDAASAPSRRRLFFPIWQRIVLINSCGLALFCAALLYLEDSRQKYVNLMAIELQLVGELLARESIRCRDARFATACLIDLDRARNLAVDLARGAGTRIRFVGQFGQPLADSLEIYARTRATDTPRVVRPAADWRLSFSRVIDRLQRWPDDLHPSMGYGLPDVPGLPGWAEPYARAWEEEVFLALHSGEPTSAHRFQYRNGHPGSVISAVTPIKDRRDRILGAVVISSTGDRIEAIVAEQRLEILRLMLAALAISVVLSAVLAHHIARPLSRLVAAANAITERRVALGGESLETFWTLAAHRNEIGTLAQAHGKMVDSLRKRIFQIKHDADTLAHRTGTKLSIVLAEAHNLLTRDAQKRAGASLSQSQRDYIGNILAAAREASDTVGLILHQAVRDAEAEHSPRESVDLSKLVREVAGEYAAESVRAGVELTLELPDEARHRAHPAQLREVLHELLANAVSFTPTGGGVRVRLEIRRAARRDAPNRYPVRLTVENDGEPIPAAIFPVIFEAGKTVRRGVGSHSGWGLWTVKRTLESVGGDIAAENVSDRAGGPAIRFVVHLP